MSETVTRVRRGGGFDDNQDPLPEDTTPVPLVANGVEPGLSKDVRSLARNGEIVELTIWFTRTVDLQDGDHLQVRGKVYPIRVLDWRSGYNTGRAGMVVLASRSEG